VRREARRATNSWLDGPVVDPPKGTDSDLAEYGRAMILDFIQGGLGWDWVKEYAGDGAFSWCGAFAAYCHDAVSLAIRKKYFASTYRLSEYGREHAGRRVATADILPGDIVVVRGTERKPYGDHICIAIAWDKAKTSLVTIEGNAHGRFPDGTWGEGVVMQQRPVEGIVAAYRPLQSDKQ
jgi:hypothetical protein